MGHRANYVIILDGKADAFYHRWGALSCTTAFAPGPDYAFNDVFGAEPCSMLQCSAFAEGGYLLDFDEKLGLIFSWMIDEEIDPSFDPANAKSVPISPAAYLAVIARNWEGWEIRWPEDGIDSFEAHLERRGIRLPEVD